MGEPRFDPPTEADPGGCTPGAVFLREMIFARWPKYRGDAGCYLHNGKTDSGNPSFHSRGRAIDVWIATGHLDVGTAIFEWCVAHRVEIGLNEVIFNRRIWRGDNPIGVHAYTVNPHTDHIHIAINRDAAQRLLPFYQRQGDPTPTTPEDQFMAALPESDQRELLAKVRDLHSFMSEGKTPGGLPWSGWAVKIGDIHTISGWLRDKVVGPLFTKLGVSVPPKP